MYNLKKQCIARVEEAFVQAEAHYSTSIKRVPITFSTKQTKTAGTAHYTRSFTGEIIGKEIRLSQKLLHLNRDVFIADTPGHEAAHIISVSLFGANGEGHGRRWREVMQVIGQQPERCHRMKTPTTNQFRYVASCGTEIHVSKAMHHKIQAGAGRRIRSTRGTFNSTNYAPNNTSHTPGVTPVVPVVASVVPVKAPVVGPGVATSKAAIVRVYLRKLKDAGYTRDTVNNNIAGIVDYALSQGFKNKAAAKSCVVANIPKVF